MASKKRAKKKSAKRRGHPGIGVSARKASRKRQRNVRRPKKSGPTNFQRFLLRDPAAAKKKMGW